MDFISQFFYYLDYLYQNVKDEKGIRKLNEHIVKENVFMTRGNQYVTTLYTSKLDLKLNK